MDELISEAMKKIAGNLCVAVGKGSGSGFMPCNKGGGAATHTQRDLPFTGELKPAKSGTSVKVSDTLTVRGGTEAFAKRLRDALTKVDAGQKNLCQQTPRLCKDNKGIARGDMPQIDGAEKVKAFLDGIRGEGISILSKVVPVSSLKSTQNELTARTVAVMAGSAVSGTNPEAQKPIIVSKDGYILDGHHRWAALMLLDPANKIMVHKVNMRIEPLLKRAFAFKGTVKRKIGERKLISLRRRLMEASVLNAVTGKREKLFKHKGAKHKHSATYQRCLKHLEAKGFDAGGQHRICYSVGAGGEGSAGAMKRKAKYGRKK